MSEVQSNPCYDSERKPVRHRFSIQFRWRFQETSRLGVSLQEPGLACDRFADKSASFRSNRNQTFRNRSATSPDTLSNLNHGYRSSLDFCGRWRKPFQEMCSRSPELDFSYVYLTFVGAIPQDQHVEIENQ
jgi:hypothetical protein